MLTNAKRRLRTILDRLRREYGPRPWKCWGKGVDILVDTILSQNTSNANSDAGYRQLRRRFRSWNQVADAHSADRTRPKNLQRDRPEVRGLRAAGFVPRGQTKNRTDARRELTKFQTSGILTSRCQTDGCQLRLFVS